MLLLLACSISEPHFFLLAGRWRQRLCGDIAVDELGRSRAASVAGQQGAGRRREGTVLVSVKHFSLWLELVRTEGWKMEPVSVVCLSLVIEMAKTEGWKMEPVSVVCLSLVIEMAKTEGWTSRSA